MRTTQLIASIKHYAVCAKTILQKPKAAARQAKESLHFYFSKAGTILYGYARPLTCAFSVVAIVGFNSLMKEPLLPINENVVGQTVFFENEEVTATSTFVLDEAKSDNKAMAKEALLWLSVLNSFEDISLTNEQLMQKFKNMSIASTILSTTADGPLRRRYWSEQAVQYGKYALGVIEGMMPDKNEGDLEEVNTRLLIAMALNYYEDGKVEREELEYQFEKISKSFLVRTGFCNNKILKSLHDDRIIELPNYLTQKYM